ncbi:flagellar hook-associated protein FlgK [Pseudooceanicola aestuarii]|uniref:flagellar hook-associated protein FlgK n=1 Tax=Pseudooceanicola aestuarii TaxID=2697319 RepID=UPI0013D728E8|nr:flagellar hook-associated protein FlgK [Pseudooceanicola aestuarii]
MSLTSAMNAARSGLDYTSRWAQTSASNIANANNEGYARRGISVVTTEMGEPRVSETWRAVDASMDRLYRTEVARAARQDSVASGLQMYATVLGDPGAEDSIMGRFTELGTALSLLSVSPGDAALQQGVVTNAELLAGSLNRANSALGEARHSANLAIQTDLDSANATLSQLAELNRRIGLEPEQSDFRLSLEDQMSQALDALAPLMDFTVQTDGSGRMTLFASGGAPLLEGSDPQLLRFDAGSGTLMAGTRDITPGAEGARGISEGSLTGGIELFNTVLPQMQDQLDQIAAGLITGFETADASLAAGEAGLFTDAGSALAVLHGTGLAGRIAVNAALVPEQGGAVWRIRDGLSATTAGASGDSTQVLAFAQMLDGDMSFDPSAGLTDTAALGDYIALMTASQQDTRARAETARDSFAAGADTIQATRMGFMGVNIDDELQQLLAIEQAYGANSRVLSVASEMIDTLLAAF